MKKRFKPARMFGVFNKNGKCLSSHMMLGAALDSSESPKTDRLLQVAVIPLDDVEALVNTARKAYYAEGPDYRGNGIRAALTAIGVLPKNRKGRK